MEVKNLILGGQGHLNKLRTQQYPNLYHAYFYGYKVNLQENKEGKHFTTISWEKICQTKQYGGLGFRRTANFNKAMLFFLIISINNNSRQQRSLIISVEITYKHTTHPGYHNHKCGRISRMSLHTRDFEVSTLLMQCSKLSQHQLVSEVGITFPQENQENKEARYHQLGISLVRVSVPCSEKIKFMLPHKSRFIPFCNLKQGQQQDSQQGVYL